MKIVLILQARMNSSRLYGKSMIRILNKPIIEFVIQRLKKVRNIDDIIIATTLSNHDDILEEYLIQKNYKYFRGSELDVLNRYYNIAVEQSADVIVRCNADCPLIDYVVVEEIIEFYLKNRKKFDYVSNILEPSYPTGMHTEVFSFEALEEAERSSTSKIEREHVTPYIYNNPKKFRLNNISLNEDLSFYRWTIDQEEDYILISKIIESLYKKNEYFTMYDVIDLLAENPEWSDINSHILKDATIKNI